MLVKVLPKLLMLNPIKIFLSINAVSCSVAVQALALY
jgi:hypothetical protein